RDCSYKSKQTKSFLDRVAESDPEMADIVAEIRRDRAAGVLRDQPWTHKACKDWWDVWLYIFRRARLHPDDHIRLKGDIATHVVWIGPDFNDKMVDLLEKIWLRLGTNRQLRELRL